MTSSSKAINNSTYTQLNISPSAFLIQNTSDYPIDCIISDTQPAAGASGSLIIEPGDGISNSILTGLVWAKTKSKLDSEVTVVE